MAPDLDSELLQKPPRNRARGDPGRCFARAGALEDVARVDPVVLEHSRKVRVPWPWPCHSPAANLALMAGGLVGHHVLPVGPVAIGNQQRNGRAQRLAGAHPGEPLDCVALDLHSGAPAVALHPSAQLVIDRAGAERQAGRQPLDNGHQAPAVRLSRSCETEVGHGGPCLPKRARARHLCRARGGTDSTHGVTASRRRHPRFAA